MGFSHTRKVCSLYQKAARTLQCWTPDRLSFRYEVTILRDRFEQNRNLTDVAKLQKVLQESEKELHEKQHYQPIKFPYSPGGVAYGRALESPDWVLDYWQEEEKLVSLSILLNESSA